MPPMRKNAKARHAVEDADALVIDGGDQLQSPVPAGAWARRGRGPARPRGVAITSGSRGTRPAPGPRRRVRSRLGILTPGLSAGGSFSHADHVLGGVGQQPGAEACAAAEVGEVGAERPGRHAADGVAADAGARACTAPCPRRRRPSGSGGAACWAATQRSNAAGALDDHAQPHVGVGGAAELRALPPVLAGRLGRERDPVEAAGHHVALAAELRHPEAVDHVGPFEREDDRPPARAGAARSR